MGKLIMRASDFDFIEAYAEDMNNALKHGVEAVEGTWVYGFVKEYMEENEGKIPDKEDIWSYLSQNINFLNDEWDFFNEMFGEILAKFNPTGEYYIRGEDLGWENNSGTMEIELDSPSDSQTLLNKVCPQTECSLRIYENKKQKQIEIVCSHHDSPMGESYYLRSKN